MRRTGCTSLLWRSRLLNQTPTETHASTVFGQSFRNGNLDDGSNETAILADGILERVFLIETDARPSECHETDMLRLNKFMLCFLISRLAFEMVELLQDLYLLDLNYVCTNTYASF